MSVILLTTPSALVTPGVDVIDTGGYRFAQHGHGGRVASRRSPYGPGVCGPPRDPETRCTVIELPGNVKLPPSLAASDD